jgi:CheY-like chemotaxis protein
MLREMVQHTTARQTVLLADDSDAVRSLLKMILESEMLNDKRRQVGAVRCIVIIAKRS